MFCGNWLGMLFQVIGLIWSLLLFFVLVFALLNLRKIFTLLRGMKPYVALYRKFLQGGRTDVH